jgi:SHS2 domain-containing protein
VTATHRFDESDELRLTVDASSFAELVAEAGRALAELGGSPPPDSLAPRETEVVVRGRDRAGLLVAWLNELIYRAESEGWLGREFRVLEAGPGTLRVRVRGSPWPARSFPVKAATLDRARVVETAQGMRAEVTLDV